MTPRAWVARVLKTIFVMKIQRALLTLGLTCAVAAVACNDNKSETNTPQASADRGAPDSGDDSTLCTKYANCDACIAGEQREGMTEGEAESACALAVTGCWVTWDKPITCGAKTYDEQPG